jgi:hypothetical protein
MVGIDRKLEFLFTGLAHGPQLPATLGGVGNISVLQ